MADGRTLTTESGKLRSGGVNNYEYIEKKIDGVGPVDKRPSTNKLHNFVKK